MAKGRVWGLWGLLKAVKNDAIILYYAWKHPGTPAFIRVALAALMAYVISPIDIVPDYLPFVGIVDDVALIPITITTLVRLLPTPVHNDCKLESEKWKNRIPWFLGLFIILIIAWLTLIIAGLGYLIYK